MVIVNAAPTAGLCALFALHAAAAATADWPRSAAARSCRRARLSRRSGRRALTLHRPDLPMATATTTRAPNVPEAGSFEAEEQQLQAQQQAQPEEGEAGEEEQEQETARTAAWLNPRSLPSNGSLCSFPMSPPPYTPMHAHTHTYMHAHMHAHERTRITFSPLFWNKILSRHGKQRRGDTYISDPASLPPLPEGRRDAFFTHATVQPTQQYAKQVPAVLQRKWSRCGQRKRTLPKQRAHANGVATTRFSPPSTRTRCAAAS